MLWPTYKKSMPNREWDFKWWPVCYEDGCFKLGLMDSPDGNGGKGHHPGNGKKTSQKLRVMETLTQCVQRMTAISMWLKWEQNRKKRWGMKFKALGQTFPWSHVEMLGVYHFKTCSRMSSLYAIYWVQILAIFMFQSSAIFSLLTFLVISPMAFLCQHSVYIEGVGDLEGENFFNLCWLDKLYAHVTVSLAFPCPGHQRH